MEKINFRGYKISNLVNLKSLYHFWGLEFGAKWKNYIKVNADLISSVLKYDCKEKVIYIFEYGTIIFVNCLEEEERIFLEFLNQLYVKINNQDYQDYYEHLEVQVEAEKFSLEEDQQEYFYQEFAIANVISKSIALSKIEKELDQLLDKAEIYLNRMEKGKLYINYRNVCKIISKTLRYDYERMAMIHMHQRPREVEKNEQHLLAYDYVCGYYELNERFSRVDSKITQLKNIMKRYETFSFSEQNHRRDFFEMILLALFPILDILLYW